MGKGEKKLKGKRMEERRKETEREGNGGKWEKKLKGKKEGNGGKELRIKEGRNWKKKKRMVLSKGTVRKERKREGNGGKKLKENERRNWKE